MFAVSVCNFQTHIAPPFNYGSKFITSISQYFCLCRIITILPNLDAVYNVVRQLRLVLNAEEYEYTDLASHGTGLRVVFHSHDELLSQPEIVRGVMLSVGTHAHINFRSPAVCRLRC